MTKTPQIVTEIVRTVSEKLGREAIFRKVNNRKEYFILDLTFSYFQKADRNRRNDYRSGYLYFRYKGKKHLLFVLAHTPIMTSFFKKNFDYEVFRNIMIATSKYRVEHFLRFKKNGQNERIRTKNIKDFLCGLDEIEKHGFVKTVFTKDKAGKTGIGNIFVLRLADDFNKNDISKIIEKSWNLFLWLYPSKPVFQRNASLNRSLQNILNECEIRKIKYLPKKISETPCSKQIEGAHIKPYQSGGSDKLENGLWLCKKHHQLTEGKLEGTRGINTFKVKFKR